MTSSAEAQLLLRLLLLKAARQWLTTTSVDRVFNVLMPQHKWFRQSSKLRDPNFLHVLLYIGGIEQSFHRETGEEDLGSESAAWEQLFL